MGWLRDKYTRSYFTGTDEEGNVVPSAEGFDAYQVGQARDFNKDLLAWLDFSGKRVLDIGFGRGEMMKYAKDNGALHIAGVDFSQPAYDLAQELFEKFEIEAEIYCDDVLNFVKGWLEKDNFQKFDIVLMFDVVEHVPRSELSEAMTLLQRMLNDKAVILINTPVFGVDNDVIKDGLDPRAMDTSDEYDNTTGMHCNRYTKESLQSYMHSLGFSPVSGHYYVYGLSIPALIAGTRLAWTLASVMGFPLRLERLWQEEKFEVAHTLAQFEELARREALSKQSWWKRAIKNLLAMARLKISRIPSQAELDRLEALRLEQLKPHPDWVTVKQGVLANHRLFLDVNLNVYWVHEAVKGTYDAQIFDNMLATSDLSNATIWDIGAHIGYHSLMFAKLVGEKGKVLAFEPNPYNIERFEMHMKENPEIASKITLLPIALSDTDGQTEFRFSSNVDNGESSGSYLSNVTTVYNPEIYEDFENMSVEIQKVDTLVNKHPEFVPSIIKVDVEGAEYEVLQGAESTIRQYRPVLYVEIHSAKNAFYVQNFLQSLNYSIELLDDPHETAMRCFMVATPDK